MSQPLHVEILSDEDEEEEEKLHESSPLILNPKRRRNDEVIGPNVVVLDDDPTPKKPNRMDSTPSFIPETPISPDLFKSDVSMVKYTTGFSDPRIGSSYDAAAEIKLSGNDNSEGILRDSPVHGECSLENAMFQIHNSSEEENVTLEHVGNAIKQKEVLELMQSKRTTRMKQWLEKGK